MKLTSGKKNAPWMALIYGVPGIGKTTTACGAPNPLGIDLEGGMNEQVIDRNEDPITDLKTFMSCLRYAYASDFDTVIIDSATALEQILTKDILKDHKDKETLDDFGYGKGYVHLASKWVEVLGVMRSLKDKGKNVILIGHDQIQKVEDPTSENYDRYQPDIHKKSMSLVVSAMDAVFFARHEKVLKDKERSDKKRGVSTGRRIVETEESAAWIAKNRFSLPSTVNLSTEIWSHLSFVKESK